MTPVLPSVSRVLVIRCGALGDLVTSTSVISALRSEYGKQITIDWIASPGSATLFDTDKRLGTVFKLKHRKVPLALSPKKRKIVAHAKKHPYDLLINLETGSHFAELAEAIPARHKFGLPFTRPTFTEGGYIHTVDHRKAIFAPAVSPGVLETSFPSLKGTPFKKLQKKFSLPERYVVLAPSNSHTGRKKINYRAWPKQHWQQLIAAIPPSVPVVLIGDEGEKKYFKKLGPYPENVISLVGKTSLCELTGIIKQARLMVTTDTGPAHIASAVSTPVAVLIGPTPFESTGPYRTGVNDVTVCTAAFPCAPCYKSDAMKACTDNLCMKAISPESVLEAMQPYLRS